MRYKALDADEHLRRSGARRERDADPASGTARMFVSDVASMVPTQHRGHRRRNAAMVADVAQLQASVQCLNKGDKEMGTLANNAHSAKI